MIICRQLKKSYIVGGESLDILKGIDLTIESGEFVAIMGPSGSGKSTLMNILGLLDVPTSGDFQINGITPSSLTDIELAQIRSTTVGFVFQQFNLLARTSALDNVLLPSLYTDLGDESGPRGNALLSAVGLEHRMDHPPAQLSGGQQQRVAIARAMMNNPAIILADEPTGNLDIKNQSDIMAVFAGLNALGKTVILITHEADIAAYARRIITIRDGRIVTDTPNVPAADSVNIHSLPNAPTRLRSHIGWISRIKSNIRQAYRSLKANTLRTFLSMLGILIGVASLIAMLALGAGAKADIETRLAGLGSNLLILSSGSSRQGAVTLDAGAVARLSPQDAPLIQSKISGIRRASATVSGRARVKHSNRNATTSIQGVMPSYAQMRATEPTIGRFFFRIRSTISKSGRGDWTDCCESAIWRSSNWRIDRYASWANYFGRSYSIHGHWYFTRKR
ncbi:ATP-binding cassette domain-containing protein [bacterium]|nr:ATP-binding cassette domain-containing protein [bacterium]